ncbi:MAG: chromate efflux transporter [Planctomycetaceae bacterium]
MTSIRQPFGPPDSGPHAPDPPTGSTDITVKSSVIPSTLSADISVWARVAALSFGGPAGQIAVMHRIIVDEQRWLSEDRFLHALNYCMLLPGPEAQQLATYIGWLRHGVRGGLLAGGLFILPGFVSILALSVVYAEYQQLPLLTGLFLGLKAAVIAIVVEAVVRIGRRVLKSRLLILLAVASFIAIFAFQAPFPLVIASAALMGLIVHRCWPEMLSAPAGHGPHITPQPTTTDREVTNTSVRLEDDGRPRWGPSLGVLVIAAALWFGPLLVLRHWLGANSIWVQEGMFFSQVAVVTFGGAYAVLTYVAQQAVDHFGWLQPGEMLDGLGLAETTPGPLIMVVQFVGFLAAYRNPGPLSPLTAGVLGAMVTAWVTFVPCFCWIFLGAPFVERLRSNRALAVALAAITAAVVGVILKLAVWFAIHTMFGQVVTQDWLGMSLPVPVWESIRPVTAGIAIVAFSLTFIGKRGMAVTLAICGSLGLLTTWLWG